MPRSHGKWPGLSLDTKPPGASPEADTTLARQQGKMMAGAWAQCGKKPAQLQPHSSSASHSAAGEVGLLTFSQSRER